jgi:transcriptional regulator with XRE-family HTH domain
VDYLSTFANRVRRLRETAGLSIQEACGKGELSTNFWGKVERAEQEPCLLSIHGIAQGLGISPQVLFNLEQMPLDNSTRTQVTDLLDLCTAEQRELALRIVRAIYEQGHLKADFRAQSTE